MTVGQIPLASICCGFVARRAIRQAVQQIHNKWKKVEFGHTAAWFIRNTGFAAAVVALWSATVGPTARCLVSIHISLTLSRSTPVEFAFSAIQSCVVNVKSVAWSFESVLSAWRPPRRGTTCHCTCTPSITLAHSSGDSQIIFSVNFMT